jgi:hypothetical protein
MAWRMANTVTRSVGDVRQRRLSATGVPSDTASVRFRASTGSAAVGAVAIC